MRLSSHFILYKVSGFRFFSLSNQDCKRFFAFSERICSSSSFVKPYGRFVSHSLLVFPRRISAEKNLVCTMLSQQGGQSPSDVDYRKYTELFGHSGVELSDHKRKQCQNRRRSGKVTLDFVPAAPVSHMCKNQLLRGNFF